MSTRNPAARVILILATVMGVVAGVACGADQSAPTATAAPLATATPTPQPVEPIRIDPQQDPEGFLAALPQSEVDCAAQAAGGRDVILSTLAKQTEIDPAAGEAVSKCISSNTLYRVLAGSIEKQMGRELSAPTLDCISQRSSQAQFSALLTQDPQAIAGLLQAMFCLDPEERAALTNSEIGLTGEDITGLECVTNRLGGDAQAALAMLMSVEGGQARGDAINAAIECGLISAEDLEQSPISLDQLSCLMGAEGDPFGTVMGAAQAGQQPTPEQVAAIEAAALACGIDLGELGLTGTPAPELPGALPPLTSDPMSQLDLAGLTPGQMLCVAGKVDPSTLAAIQAGTVTTEQIAPLVVAATDCGIDPASLIKQP